MQLKDVSNLGYVRELNLIWCPKVRDVGALGKVTNYQLEEIIEILFLMKELKLCQICMN